MEKYVRIVPKNDVSYEDRKETMDNNNSSWDADKSLRADDLSELGCDVLPYSKKGTAPERKKRERSIIKPEDICQDFSSAEIHDLVDSQKTKHVKSDSHVRFISKPSCVSRDGFSRLSDEIVLGVFKYLSHEDLKYVAAVNQRFRRLSNDESLWPRFDLAGKMLNTNSLGYVMKKGVKVLRLKEATVKPPIWDPHMAYILHGYHSKIELLDFSYGVISPQDLALLFSKCRNIRKLSLESCEVSHEVFSNLTKNSLLDTLNLAMAEGIDSEGLGILCSSCERLQNVNLAWTKLDEEAVNTFVNSVSENLVSLNLSGLGFSVTNNSVRTLVRRCPRLVELDISDCFEVTSSIVTDIAEALPNIKALAVSRCYKIDPKILILNMEKMPSLISLTAFRLIGSVDAKNLEMKYNLLRVNKDFYSTIARPTVGVRRSSIWTVRCRD